MEVVGVVAAVPGLIEIIRALITAVRGLSSRKAGQKAAADLVVELQDLHDILNDVQKRWRHYGPASGASRLQRLPPVLAQLETDLGSLKTTLNAPKFTKNPLRFLRRIFFLSTSLEKTLKESLTRLSQVKTSLTLIIAHHNDAVAQELLDISTSDLRLKLRTLLHPSGHAFIPKRLEHTCEWIWFQPQFRAWATKPCLTSPPQSDTSRIFCLYGVKGCGKSVLAKSIAETLRCRGDIALHFSFWAESETQRKLLDLLRTILWQLMNRLPQHDFRRLSEPLLSEATITLRSVTEAMRSALNLLHTSVYCIIDGVDESVDDWNDSGDGKPLPTVLGLARSHPKLHLLLCGREPSMRTVLKGPSPRLEVAETHIRDDMDRLIAAELDSVLAIQTPEVKAMVQASLAEKSHVMFLWATLILQQLKRCFNLEEIKNTLSQVPRDLDREYHRLFSRLMIRTGATTAKPSPSTRRARRLLTAILASPEPMTAEELCYAHASLEDSSGKIEDNMIPVDGITDASGDFVRVTNGRYHLLHSSVTDFLTRPLGDWAAEDSDIVYFHLTRGDAQRSMGSACLRYIESLDLEASLTYDNLMELLLRHPFLSYAVRFLPFFFSEVMHLGDVSWAQSHASRFVGTAQGCALLECAAKNFQQMLDNEIDYLRYWMNLFDEGSWWRGVDLVGAYDKELRRRLEAFGAHDRRYRSWLSFSPFILASRPSQSVNTKAHEAVLRALPQYLAQTQGSSGLRKLSRSVHVVSHVVGGPLNWLPNLLAMSVESLPAPVILFMAIRANMRPDKPLARNLTAIAVEKYKNTAGLLEANSLLLLANLSYDLAENQEAERLVRQSVQIVDRLPPSFQMELTRIWHLYLLTCTLIFQGRYEEASDELRGLVNLVGSQRQKARNRLLDYFLCHTKLGIVLRITTLSFCAYAYMRGGLYTDAARLASDAITILESARISKLHAFGMPLLLLKRALYRMGEYQACISVSQRFLHLQQSMFRDGRDAEEIDEAKTIRWLMHLHMARCHGILGQLSHATDFYHRAADGCSVPVYYAVVDSLTTLLYDHGDEPERLVADLALVGEYERSASIGLRILEYWDMPYASEAAHMGFQVLGPLVKTLQALGSIDDDCERFLSYSAILLLLRKGRRFQTPSESWLDYGRRIMWHKVSLFRQKSVLAYLMYIDVCLRSDGGGVEPAVVGYRAVARVLHHAGGSLAAALVASDGAARCFASTIPPRGLLGPGLLLASDASRYHGVDAAQGDVLLRSSYCADRRGCSDARGVFRVESMHARITANRVRSAAEDGLGSDGVRLAQLARAGVHLIRAREASRSLRADYEGCAWREDAGEDGESRWSSSCDDNDSGSASSDGSYDGGSTASDDSHDSGSTASDDSYDSGNEESREEILDDLETKLRNLGAGQLLDAAEAEAEDRRRRARRVRSFGGYALDRPQLVVRADGGGGVRRVCSAEGLGRQEYL